MTRKQSREQAFILLFEYSFTDDTADELFAIADEAGVESPDDYCIKVVNDAIDNIDVIDEQISKYSKGWSTSRISKVALAALRVAIAEIMYFDNIPESVSINECVELIKKYASEQDASFANGILGSVVRAKSE